MRHEALGGREREAGKVEEPSPRPSPAGPPRGRGRGALEAAGVRVVRVKWGRGYDLEEVEGVLWGVVKKQKILRNLFTHQRFGGLW